MMINSHVWTMADDDPHSWYVPVNRIWRQIAVTTRSWWCLQLAGNHSDREYSIVNFCMLCCSCRSPAWWQLQVSGAGECRPAGFGHVCFDGCRVHGFAAKQSCEWGSNDNNAGGHDAAERCWTARHPAMRQSLERLDDVSWESLEPTTVVFRSWTWVVGCCGVFVLYLLVFLQHQISK